MINSQSTRKAQKPTAHICYTDSDGRVFLKKMPVKTVRVLSECLALNPPSVRFPDDWLMSAMQYALATRGERELFEHPEYSKVKVPQQDAIRLLTEAAAVPFAKQEGKMSPYYAMLSYSQIYLGFMRSLLAYKSQ